MTNTFLKSLQSITLVSAGMILLSSCLKDNCQQFYTYKLYKPVYLSYEELRKPVHSVPAIDLKNTGKIYYREPYIFVNEIDAGVHVIDNTNPSSPQNMGFISIAGNVDIAIKDNILYADSYIDLVALDISDPLNVKEIWRDQEVFPQRTYNGWVGDAARGVVTAWVESDTTIEQPCNNASTWIFFEGDALATTTSGGTNSTSTGPGIGISGSMARFAIASDHLYCLNASIMNLYDISNAAQPANQGVVTMPWNVETLFSYDEYLFVGSTTGVSIYQNSNPASPLFISSVSHVTGCDPVVVSGNYAYSTIHTGNLCGQSWNELNVIDISNIYSPVIKNTITLSSPYGLGIDGNRLFICDDASGLKMFDATDPQNPEWLQTVLAGTTRDVIPLNGLLLLVSTEGLYQFDYSSGTLTQLSFIPVEKG